MEHCIFLKVLVVAALTSACLERGVSHERPIGHSDVDAYSWKDVTALDLLFVVDDSLSMADKQVTLSRSLEALSIYATSCVDVAAGSYVSPVEGRCPVGYQSTPFWRDGSRAVISTSLAAGGIACAESDRRAHPLPLAVVDEQGGPEWANYDAVVATIRDVGGDGCGYEAPLEAAYRFLVDPEPPLLVTTTNEGGDRFTTTVGIDEEVLAAREAFLHPVSQVGVIILTDEDDCSVKDSGRAWRVGAEGGLARATAACASDPNDPCCQSCDAPDPAAGSGCPPLATDAICGSTPTYTDDEDPANLRCWNAKRRFGEDWLFPIERYREGFSGPTVTSRSGEVVDNPLFAQGRTPDMVSVLLLGGVPWQFITTPGSRDDPDVTEFLAPEALGESRVWDAILGEPSAGVPPSDPHLVASVDPRPDLPLAGDPLDPVHGHEVVRVVPDELQYSCIYPLPEPRDCGTTDPCDCDSAPESPLCRAADGSYGQVQYFAKAYPPLRLLELVKGLGAQGFLGSVCPRQQVDPAASGFGYSDAMLTFYRGAWGSIWDLTCGTVELPLRQDGTLRCQLLEGHVYKIDCEAQGRLTASGPFREAFLRESLWRAGGWEAATVCELPQLPGDPRDPSTPAYACANELHPAPGQVGYCYVDPAAGIGNPELVEFCAADRRRRVRLIPQNLPLPETYTALVCDFGHL